MTAAPIFAVQYLESPHTDATPALVRRRLRKAFERLPFSLVILGWDLPISLEEAVAEETRLHNAQLFRWQPLLTGDSHFAVPLEWSTIGNSLHPVSAYNGMPEFNFFCPNKNAVIDFLEEGVEKVAAKGIFQGLFLDRIRYPSPCIDPFGDLACFCENCSRQAEELGFDLESVRQYINSLSPGAIVGNLFRRRSEVASPFDVFMSFREATITHTVRTVSRLARSLGLAVGLDCFSPALSRLVGQDLPALSSTSDWVKIMVYPRVFGPAGISFELLNLVNWLMHHGLGENETMQLLTGCCGLPLPKSKTELSHSGLESIAITQEIQRGREMGIPVLLAGIAMVNMEKIHTSSPEQIQSDIIASQNADGLVISWDLWLTPLSYLDDIRNHWS